MKISRILLLFIYIYCYSISTSGQNSINVTQLPILDQLPSNSVQSIFQDKRGYLWLGTQDGLCRFDGVRLKVFRSDFKTPDLLSNNHITAITQDYNGNLIIGTKSGVNLLDLKTLKVRQLKSNDSINNEVRSITVTSDSCIWVSYYRNIFCYDQHYKVIDKSSTSKDNYSLPTGAVNCIFEDSYKNIWLGYWTKGLYKYNRTSHSVTKYPKIGSKDNPFKIFQDHKNNYWIGTWDDGLYIFNPDATADKMFTQVNEANGLHSKDNTFYGITQDDYLNYVWVMSLTGIHAFKYVDQQIKSVDIKSHFSKTNNIFSEIIKSNTGNLWIGAFSEGALSVNFNKPLIDNFPVKLLQNKINVSPSFAQMCEDSEQNIWVHQNRLGLCMYSPTSEKLSLYTEIEGLKDTKELKYVSKLTYIKSTGEIWTANSNNHNITIVQKATNTYNTKYKQLPSESSGNITAFFEDSESNIWIGTSNSLFVKPNHKDQIITVKKDVGDISTISQDVNHKIWVATENNGLIYLDQPSEILKNLKSEIQILPKSLKIREKNIVSVTGDYGENVWFASKEGKLYAYNIYSKKLTDYSKQTGLQGESILDILIDKFNHVWIMTYKDIIEFNPQNKAHYKYSASDNMLVNSHLKGSFFKSLNSNKIYIGGNRGYSCFYVTNHLSEPTKANKVEITDIKIRNKSIYLTDDITKYDIDKKELVLNPKDNNLEIHYSALNFDNDNKIKFKYKLEGVDEEWIEDNSRHYAIYNQLKKGSYTFKIKATDEYGIWNSPISEVNIYRQAAFYETNIAYLFYIIMLGGIFSIILYISLSRAKLKNKAMMADFEKGKSEELTQTKLNYFTNISHDFLTPLTIISYIIDDVEHSSPKTKVKLAIARSNIVRLKRLLKQVLDFKKMDNGKMELRVTQGDLSTFTKEICLSHFAPLFKNKNISFEVSCQDDITEAWFDTDKIDKVLFNLVSNALKYTPSAGKVTVSLSTKTQYDHLFAAISIKDNGIGIQSDEIGKIFTPFYTNKGNQNIESNGIGLSLCKDLIELHHGSIKVSSKLNLGSTFTISFPIDHASYTPREISTNAIIDIDSDNEQLITDQDDLMSDEKTNILLVEDNPDLLELMKNLLKEDFYIYTASNGLEAIKIIEQNNIHIIISDVMMPEMNGYELCKKVKGCIETNHITFILLTSKSNSNDKIEGYEAGADDYLSKPFELKELKARLNNFLKNKTLKQQEFKANAEINISALEYPSPDENFLNQAIQIIENNLSETDFDVNKFADQLNISKSSLYRKIKTITDLSPVEFVRNVKLKHACEILKNNKSIIISEVAYMVGFSDPKYFSSCFKTEFNMTPRDFVKKHARD